MLGAIKRWNERIRGWLAARKMEEEFFRELDGHLELLAAEYVRRGGTAEEARRRAKIKMGGRGQLRDEYLENAGLPQLENLARDLRLRALRKRSQT